MKRVAAPGRGRGVARSRGGEDEGGESGVMAKRKLEWPSAPWKQTDPVVLISCKPDLTQLNRLPLLVPAFQMTNLRHREGKFLAQSHVVGE